MSSGYEEKHTNDLSSQEVVSWGDAGWEVKVPPSSVGDQVIDCPTAGLGIESLGRNLGPLGRGSVRGGRVVDLCKVGLHWSLVGSSNRVVSVVGSVVSWNVLPVGTNLVASIDSDDRVGGSDIVATGKVGGLDVHDWVVGVLSADTGVSWLNLSIDGDLVKNGVRGGSGAQRRENRCNGELHGGYKE